MSTRSPAKKLLSIGQVAKMFAIRTSAIRYYEDRGLVSPAERRGGQRYYGHAELRRLALILTWQRTGLMSLDEIAELLTKTHDRSWRQEVHSRVQELTEQINRIQDAQRYLEHLLRCPSDHPAGDCPHLAVQLAEQVRRLSAQHEQLPGR